MPRILFICICCLLVCENACAGTLTIRMQTTISVASDFINAEIATTNTGTEPAHNVYAFLHIFDRFLESEVLDILEVRQTRSFYFKISHPPGKRGRFPFVGEVLFHDANHHPFSALSCATFNLKSKSISYLTGHAPDLTIKERGNLSLQITNLASCPRTCTATLYLPHGLTTSVRHKDLQLDPCDRRKVDFLLKNRYGIGGASYPVFCTLEYEEKGIHHAEIVRSTIYVKEYKNWFLKTRWYWLGGMVLLLLGWIGMWLFKKKTLTINC